MDTNTDRRAIGFFSMGFVQDGLGEDGLPLFRETVLLTIARPPLLKIQRVPDPSDMEAYADEYAAFMKTQDAKRETVDGFPLAMWAAIGPADLENCVARGVRTVQQLAALPVAALPPAVRELVERARRMLDLQKDVGRHEFIIDDLRGQVTTLQGELKEALATISAQMSMIEGLRSKAA